MSSKSPSASKVAYTNVGDVPKNYGEALYGLKRGFLIIGLTGFTGAGCSTVRSILASKTGPDFPEIPHSEIGSASDGLALRRYEKMRSLWQDQNGGWDQFVVVDVSVVIFAHAVVRALFEKGAGEVLNKIRSSFLKSKQSLEGLRLLGSGEVDFRKKKNAKDLVSAYEECRKAYISFIRDHYARHGELEEFIYAMQNFGDELR